MNKLGTGLLIVVLSGLLAGCYTRSCHMGSDTTTEVKQTVIKTTTTTEQKVVQAPNPGQAAAKMIPTH